MTFAGIAIVALLQGEKPFMGDSGDYWKLGETFTVSGHFSLLNFQSQDRGYALPLIYYELRAFAGDLGWSGPSMVKLFNALLFTLIGAVLAPRLAETAWPQQRWSVLRRMTLAVLLIVFWSGHLNFPLSDFPSLAMALLALIAIARFDAPAWMLVAGAAGGLALDMRASYLLLPPLLIALLGWAWLDQRGTRHASGMHRALCASMLVLGFAVVSLPQSLSAHRYLGTWSFVPGAATDLSGMYLTVGLRDELVYADYTHVVVYRDKVGEDLLRGLQEERIDGYGQYVGLIWSHPLAMGGVFSRHTINGLDQRYTTPYVEHPHSELLRLVRILGFMLVFLGLVRVLWPPARRSLGPARWRYPVALVLCCLTSIPAAMETRYLLPVFLFFWILVLTPGTPAPTRLGNFVPTRPRALAILAVAALLFTAVIWHVTSATSRNITAAVSSAPPHTANARAPRL